MDNYESDWCNDCHCPKGLGPCDGCRAYAAAMADDDFDPEYSDDDDD